MAGIKIPFLADVAGFLRGTRDVSGALDDVADSLDDVARDAAKTGDKVGDELKDGGREGERSAEKLERKFRQAFDDVKRESRRAGDDVGDNVKRGTDRAGDGLDNMKDEAHGTAREVAASFDGSAESIAGGFQEVAANALSGFGPAGAVAGLAVAAGAGLAFNAWQENAEKIEQRVSDMYEDMIESGKGFLSEDLINQRLQDIYGKTEDAEIKWGDLQDIVRRTGLTQETVARAFAGDAAAQAELLGGLEGALETNRDLLAQQGIPPGTANSTTSILNGYVTKLEGVTRAQEDANSRARGYESAVRTGMQGAAAAVAKNFPLVQPPPLLLRVRTPTTAEVQGQFTAMLRGVVLPPISIRAKTGGPAL